jgi:hypothetical protein
MTTIRIAPSHADMARRMLTTPRCGKLDWLWQWDTYEFRARTAKGGHDVGLIHASAGPPPTPVYSRVGSDDCAHVSRFATAPALGDAMAHIAGFAQLRRLHVAPALPCPCHG